MIEDPSGSLAKLIDAVITERLAAVNVAFPCRVLSFDADKLMATVQPLLQVFDQPPSPIQNVPVLGQKMRAGESITTWVPALSQGDVVYVVCADRQIKNSITGQVGKPDVSRIHNRNDAVIVGVFPCSLQSS
jgi:xanthosine utilization system XapX-like protein